MSNHHTTDDFDGCRRPCRQAAAHTLVYGDCEHAPAPEPTVSLPRVYTDTDGLRSIGFDTYTVAQLADLITPVLVHPEEGFGAPFSNGYARALAIAVAKRLVHRDDGPATADETARRARWEAAAHAAGREVDRNALRAFMAVADAEQVELRAEVERLGDWCRTVTERAETAEADRDRWHGELAVNEADRVAAVELADQAAAALAAVLPSSPTRADTLRWAADRLDESETLRDLTDDHMHDVHAAANELRRLADEAQPDTEALAAAECSAQNRNHESGPRLCIRAAQHQGDHIDERGFHWSDTVAVYPVGDGTFREGVDRHTAAAGVWRAATEQQGGPPCGNNPNFRLTPGDRQAVDNFKAYLAQRAAGADEARQDGAQP